MSPQVPENAKSWRKRSDIDYFPLFVPLWLAFDAWLRTNYDSPTDTDRKRLEKMKRDEINNFTFHRTRDLLLSHTSAGETFRDYFAQLNEALRSQGIEYQDDPANRKLGLDCGLVERDGSGDRNNDIYEDLTRTRGQRNKIVLIKGVYITDEIPKVYRAYIEFLYQVRCYFFHGVLESNKGNERIIKYLYLTLRDIFKF